MWLDRISPKLNILWRGEWAPHFVEPARFLYDYELVIVTQGRFALRVGEKQWEMKAGSFAIIPPDTNHSSLAGSQAVFRSCIHFDWISSGRVVKHPICSYFPKRPARRLMAERASFAPQGVVVGTCPQDGPIASLVETIFLRWQAEDALSRSLCRGPFLELVLRLLTPPSQAKPERHRDSQLAYAAKELLDIEGQRADAGIVRLLQSLGYSYPHVCRLFHKSFGLSPVSYLNAQRLERAKSLLGNPRLTVAEVAYQAGFRDPGYFSRLFRRQTGMTPVRFRTAIHKGGTAIDRRPLKRSKEGEA